MKKLIAFIFIINISFAEDIDFALHEARCDGGVLNSCFILATKALEFGDLNRARKYYLRSCNLGFNVACNEAMKFGIAPNLNYANAYHTFYNNKKLKKNKKIKKAFEPLDSNQLGKWL